MKLLFVLTALCAPVFAQDFDVLIRHGRIADGTGNPSFIGDVGIRNGRIAAIGTLPDAKARKVIDAAGLIVAPGFIDIHNHSDFTLLADGNAQSMVRQGVTSMILGEGGSAAPLGGKQQEKQAGADWTDLHGYFARLLKSGISTNVGTYVGSSQVWTYVHGEQGGKASPEEIQQMQNLVRTAMKQGALGVASSLSGPPGSWIDTETMVAMCKAAGEFGGIYSTHVRNEGDGVFQSVQEAIDIGKQAGVPVDVIHLKIADHALWGRMPQLVGLLLKAREAGQDVTANVYPYRAGQNNLASIVPPWAHEGGVDAMLKRLKDPSLHDRLVNEIEHGIPGSGWYDHYTATGSWEGMLLVSLSNPAYKKFEGRRMSEVVAALGGKPVDVLFKVLEDNRGSVPTIYFHHDENDMRYALKQPFISIGSDGTAIATEGPTAQGHPHPRYYGTFPRVLGRYVRDEKVLSLEEAIRKMTSANAAKVHVYDRGLLRPGMWADVAVFDLRTIIDNSTWEKPHQYSTGVRYLVVNGKVVLNAGEHTGERPGQILYGPAKAPDQKAQGTAYNQSAEHKAGATLADRGTALSSHDAAEWVIRQGGNVQLAGSTGRIRNLESLPEGKLTVTAVDLIGTTIDPKDLWKLSGLAELRELLLPGPSFNPGAGSKLDANEEFAALAGLHNLEKLWFSLHFLSNINVQDKGLEYLKDLTQIRELRLVQAKVLGPGLAPFTNLRALDLGDTPFRDEGMQYLRGMTHLERLSLRNTLISDAGLKNLENLRELESLDLYGTRITDDGLRSLRGLNRLQSLNVLGASITDAGLATISSLPGLVDLDLYRTQISNAGLEKLKSLKKLASLDIRYTRVTSGGAESFRSASPKCQIEFEDTTVQSARAAELRKTRPQSNDDRGVSEWVHKMGGLATTREGRVREVNLSRTPVSDAQMAFLDGLSGLEKLSLAATEIGDAATESLSKLASLQELDLSGTMVTDAAVSKFAGMRRLNRLVLNNSQVRGAGFGAFSGVPLEDIELSGAPVSDEGMRAISALKNVRRLRLSYSDVSDAGFAPLESLVTLEHLDLSATDIGDSGVGHLKTLKALKELELNYSRITNPALENFTSLPALERLEIARTRINDGGAPLLAKLTSLKSLNLDYTTLSDKGLALIRQSIPGLTELRLDSATLTDSSVPVLSGMKALRILNLYHTLITEKGFEALQKALPECQIIFDRDSSLPNRRHS